MKPYMTNNEIEFIKSFFSDEFDVLEWGSGGSTIYFSKFCRRYFSIEHDKAWYDKIDKIKPENVQYFYVKNNLPRSRPTKKEEFMDYINFVDKIGMSRYDLVLIDGRARVFCAEKALDYVDDESLVFIHDWERKQYHSVLDFYNVYETKDRVAALIKK